MWVETSFAFNLRLKQEAAQWPILFPLPVTYTQGPTAIQSWKANFLVQTHILTCTLIHSVFLFLKHGWAYDTHFFSILLLSLNIIPKRFFPTSTQDHALRQRSCCSGNRENSSEAHTTWFWLWLCLGLWFHDSAPRPVSTPSWLTGPSSLISQTSFLHLTMTPSPDPVLFLLLLSCHNNNIPESLCFVYPTQGEARLLGSRLLGLSMRHTFQIQMPHQQINLQERGCSVMTLESSLLFNPGMYSPSTWGKEVASGLRWHSDSKGRLVSVPQMKRRAFGAQEWIFGFNPPRPLHITSFHPHALLPCLSLSNFLPRFPFSPPFLTPYFSSLLSLCLSLRTWPLPGSL